VKTLRSLTVMLVLLLLATSCAPPQAGAPKKSATPAPSILADSPSPSPSPLKPSHVFVIVMENSSYESAMAQPYLSQLASQYAVATDYHPITTPSLPNYLAMTSGSTWGIRDDNYHRLPSTGLGVELTDSGIPWKAYMEGFSGDCFNSPYPYALKHNPFAYFGGQCPSNIVPMTQLATDLGGDTAQLSWITPGLCHDGHDCSRQVADQWLAAIVPQILASAAWQDNGVLFITADESDSGGDRVPLVIAAPQLNGQQLTQTYDHYSLLATISDDLGVTRPGESAQANPISLNG